MIHFIYICIIFDGPFIVNVDYEGEQAIYERIYDYIHNFFKDADKLFINCFVDNLQYLEN